VTSPYATTCSLVEKVVPSGVVISYLTGKIKDRGVNSLFDYKENYNRSIILLQERGDIQAQISTLPNNIQTLKNSLTYSQVSKRTITTFSLLHFRP